MSEDLGRKRLLAKLEGIFTKWITNNGNPIRYPVTWRDGSRLRGKHKILNVDNCDWDRMWAARYVFGANEVRIYCAIDEILKYIEERGGGDIPLICMGLEDEDDI